MVKSAQHGVSHNSAWSVETNPLALELLFAWDSTEPLAGEVAFSIDRHLTVNVRQRASDRRIRASLRGPRCEVGTSHQLHNRRSRMLPWGSLLGCQ
jgi:hypothetical protein